MKSDRYQWEPSSAEEAGYYDKLFKVVDRENAGAIGGKAAVKFLSLSGLPISQLQNVWAAAKSSEGQLFLRNEFRIAMRVVALAQSGEVTLTRKKLRETAASPLPIAQLKGAPRPPVQASKGKEPPPLSPPTTSPKIDHVSTPGKDGRKAINAKGVTNASKKAAAEERTVATSAFSQSEVQGQRQKALDGGEEGKNTKAATKTAGQISCNSGTNRKIMKTNVREDSDGRERSRSDSDGGSSSEASSKSDDIDGNCGRSSDEDSKETASQRRGRKVAVTMGKHDGGSRKDSSIGNRDETSRHTEKKRRDRVGIVPSTDVDEKDADTIDTSHDRNDNSSVSDSSQGTDQSEVGTGVKPTSNSDASGGNNDSDSASASSNGESSRRVENEGDNNHRGQIAPCSDKRAKPICASSSGRASEGGSSSPSPSTSADEDDEDDSNNPFRMSEKARGRYQAVFEKMASGGSGRVSGRTAVAILAKSGLDKASLARIWSMSDLDEDGQLSDEEFAIAFHLVGCVAQKKFDLPEELPKSLWPDGYVPPFVLERRREQARLKAEKEEAKAEAARLKQGEEEQRKKAHKIGETAEALLPGKNSNDGDTIKRKKKSGKGEGKAQALHIDDERAAEVEEEKRAEEAERAVSALAKKEELERKRAARNAAGKNKQTRRQVNNAFVANSATGGGEVSKGARSAAVEAEGAKVLSEENAIGDDTLKRKTEKTKKMATSGEGHDEIMENDNSNDGKGIAGIQGDDMDAAEVDKRTTKKKKKRNRRRSSSADMSRHRESSSGHDAGEATPAGPLSPTERRERKARARAARLEENERKKEAAKRNARLAELDKEDETITLSVKIMDPMKTSNDAGNLHLLSDTGNIGGESLSFSRLSAPLLHLTPNLGARPPSLRKPAFSVAFPSGVRRASTLTSSLELRLGPELPADEMMPRTGAREGVTTGSNGPGIKGYTVSSRASDDSTLVRCRHCAALLPSIQLEQHLLSSCRLLPCPLCKRLLLPAAREMHLQAACPKRKKCCARCGKAVVVSDFARHDREDETGGCSRRVVKCRPCGAFCLADELREHEANECPERKCECASCGDILHAKELREHASRGCRNITWTCRCGKVDPMPLMERPGHLKKCDAFLDAWEASIEKILAKMPKIEVVRRVGKVMVWTRVENPGLALMALSECKGDVSFAARRISDDGAYLNEVSLAANIVNVQVFLNSLQKPGKRYKGSLWREGENENDDAIVLDVRKMRGETA